MPNPLRLLLEKLGKLDELPSEDDFLSFRTPGPEEKYLDVVGEALAQADQELKNTPEDDLLAREIAKAKFEAIQRHFNHLTYCTK